VADKIVLGQEFVEWLAMATSEMSQEEYAAVLNELESEVRLSQEALAEDMGITIEQLRQVQ